MKAASFQTPIGDIMVHEVIRVIFRLLNFMNNRLENFCGLIRIKLESNSLHLAQLIYSVHIFGQVFTVLL